jgi:microcystin-dependent protein
MANYSQTSKNFTGAFMTGIQGVSTGIVIPWSSASIPSGFLECNGAAVSRSTYSALFAVISTTYGIGDGTTTFNLPDLTDRTVVNKSNTKNLAQTGGANTVTRTGNISGTVTAYALTTAEIPSHAHSGMTGMSGAGQVMSCSDSSTGSPARTSSSTGGGGTHTHNLSANFVGSADSVLQPYLVMIYIIKT